MFFLSHTLGWCEVYGCVSVLNVRREKNSNLSDRRTDLRLFLLRALPLLVLLLVTARSHLIMCRLMLKVISGVSVWLQSKGMLRHTDTH